MDAVIFPALQILAALSGGPQRPVRHFGLFENNFENNFEIYSEQLAEQMEAVFELHKTNAEEITLQSWENRPFSEKLLEYAISPLRPFG